jgi:hypothetical protein
MGRAKPNSRTVDLGLASSPVTGEERDAAQWPPAVLSSKGSLAPAWARRSDLLREPMVRVRFVVERRDLDVAR